MTNLEVTLFALDQDLDRVTLVECLQGPVFGHYDDRLELLKAPSASSAIVQNNLVLRKYILMKNWPCPIILSLNKLLTIKDSYKTPFPTSWLFLGRLCSFTLMLADSMGASKKLVAQLAKPLE